MSLLPARTLPILLATIVFVGAGHPHPAQRPEAGAPARQPGVAVRMNVSQAQQLRQERIHTIVHALTLRYQAAASSGSAAPTPRPVERSLHVNRSDANGADGITAVDHNDALANQSAGGMIDAPPPPGVLAVGPVTDAVAHICGPSVTVCGVWWPTAVTDKAQYQNCVHQAGNSNELDFGTSAAEYCSALYTGDCEGAGPGSDLAEMCSLVPGVAAQWTSQYGYSNFITHGDCALFKTVDVREHNVLGFQLQQPDYRIDTPPATRDSSGKASVKICTGRLYLKILQ